MKNKGKVAGKLKEWWHSLQTRSSLALLVTAAVLIQVTGAVEFIFARNAIRKEVQQRARTEIKLRSMEIQNVILSVETAINNMQWVIDWSIYNPDSIYSTMELIIRNNPVITGCAMAFEPGYFPEQGHWYEPFVGRENGLSGKVVRRQIGSEEHDYFKATWYQEGLTTTGGRWSEPYIDNAGSKMMVSSYTMPIHDPSGRVVGVFCSDVSLEWLTDLFGHQGSAFTFLASRTGRLLACPDKSMVMNTTIQEVAEQFNDTMIDIVNSNMVSGDSGEAVVHDNNGDKSYIYYSPVEGNTGWSMAIVFPHKDVYSGLYKVGNHLFIFMILGLLLMMFIMWRSIRGYMRLQAATADKERMGSELRIASGIQMGMLPKTFPPYPKLEEVSMFGSLVPAKEVGGDLYDFHVNNDKLFFCIGDVSGKGVPAALVMAVTRSLFRSVSSHENDPSKIMTTMNNAMSEMNESSMFVTLFIGVLNLRNGQLNYSNAGHNPSVTIKDKAEMLPVDANIPLGLIPNWTYTNQQSSLQPGDTIFLYTDGLTEAENASHQLFGEERMMEILSKTTHNPHDIINTMTDAIHKFVGDAEQSDDLTMLAIEPNQFLGDEKLPDNCEDITLPNDVKAVPQLASFIEEVAEKHGADLSTVMNINLALEEAVVNVMNYAYPKGTSGEINVNASFNEGTLVFTLSDAGTPFDPTQSKEPDLSLEAEDRPIGGLGIHLIRQLMDSIEYRRENGRNILTLKKKLKTDN